MKTIKIITINTWKCDGDYTIRIRILAEQLKSLAPDIVACQECFYSEEANTDTLKFLAAGLNMNYNFTPGRSKKRLFDGAWVESQSGLGILSTYPITNVYAFTLPNADGDDDRKAQQAEITLPSGKIIAITNTHLTHLGNANGATSQQAGALAAFVLGNNTSIYHLVCGDFNASTASAEITEFKNKTKAIDCFTAGNGAEPRYSLAEAFKKGKLICVDHIFALPFKDTNDYPEFINSGVVLNDISDEYGIYPSDHFGISTTLVINDDLN